MRTTLPLALLVLSSACASGGPGVSEMAAPGDVPALDEGNVSTLMCPGGPTWEVDGSREPPVALNREQVFRRLADQYAGPRTAGMLQAVLAVRVTRGGSVDDVCIVRSSGIPEFDRVAVSASLGLRYRPATTDGEPRSVSSQFAMRLNVRR